MKGVLFDFDGTLADTLDASLEVLATLAQRHGYRLLTREDVRETGTREALRRAGVRTWDLPWLARQARQEMTRHLNATRLFPGVPELLADIKLRGLWTGILTSNSEGNVRTVLENAGLPDGSIDEIFSGTDLFGKHRALKRILKHKKWTPQDLVYVGDETRDIDACTKAGVPVFAVDWGYHSRELLDQHHAGPIASDPEALSLALLHHLALKKGIKA